MSHSGKQVMPPSMKVARGRYLRTPAGMRTNKACYNGTPLCEGCLGMSPIRWTRAKNDQVLWIFEGAANRPLLVVLCYQCHLDACLILLDQI